MTAALAGISRLPAVLKVRPVGDVDATLAHHPGIAVLEEAGVCRDQVLDPDVADWMLTLGRPDIEVAIMMTRPEKQPDRLLGPPPVFDAPQDPIAAAEALSQWRAQMPAQRAVALCRRGGWWVAAARVWRAGDETVDEIVVSPLGQTPVAAAVNDVIGPVEPAQFNGVNVEAEVLESIMARWQAQPDTTDVVTELADAGMTVPQARVVAAGGDAGATRTVVTALQYSLEGPQYAPAGITIVDTIVGRVLISSIAGPDGRQWTMLFPGTTQRVATAVTELLEGLPSGRGWVTHERTQ